MYNKGKWEGGIKNVWVNRRKASKIIFFCLYGRSVNALVDSGIIEMFRIQISWLHSSSE